MTVTGRPGSLRLRPRLRVRVSDRATTTVTFAQATRPGLDHWRQDAESVWTGHAARPGAGVAAPPRTVTAARELGWHCHRNRDGDRPGPRADKRRTQLSRASRAGVRVPSGRQGIRDIRTLLA